MGHSPEFAAPTKRFKWSAGSVDPLYNAMLGLLKSSSSISLPFTMRSSLGSGSSISKFSRIGLALFRLLCSLIIDFMAIVSFRFVLSLEGEFLLGRLDLPDLRLLWD
ncbi:hypothetical protein Tco_1070882 [Tanacetum coccineum]|uniref:Uncharacterized protein n=1 Tax=Tanacetum coccineum TaxID=301880 RepID=A0ABQ5HMP4_9ASTR